MSAVSRFKNTLLGSVAAAAILGSVLAPAASAVAPPVSSAAAPVSQGGPVTIHPFSIRLLSVYVHDDGDGFGLGAGEFEDQLTEVAISVGG